MNETTPPIMTINDELLAELEAAADAASAGEWVSTGPSFGQSSPAYLDAVVTFNDGEESTVCTMPDWSEEYWPERTANAAFIATANPTTILALLQHVRELKADAERYRWLRDESLNTSITAPAIMVVDEAGYQATCSTFDCLLCGEDADAAIDAARSSAD